MSGPPDTAELRLRARELAPDGSLAEAARVLLCLQAREIEAALPRALSSPRPGPLHDARVASRRLRAGITLFQRLYPGRWHSTVGLARTVTHGLREARDLDIRRARLERLSRRLGVSGRCRTLLQDLSEEASAARFPDDVRAALAAVRLGPVLDHLWRPMRPRTADAGRFAAVWLASLSQVTLNTLPAASVEAHGGVQHRLRIRGKALRYSLEMMQWRLGGEARWRTTALREAQEVLGEIHDIDVLLEYLRGESGRRGKADRRCLGQAGEMLQVERHRFFRLFLHRRPELEEACRPVRFP
jgi:CHAD domain-containing protein